MEAQKIKLPAKGVFRLTVGTYKDSNHLPEVRNMVDQALKFALIDQLSKPGTYHLKKIWSQDCPYEKRVEGEPAKEERFWLIGHLLDTEPLDVHILAEPIGALPADGKKLIAHLWTDDMVLHVSDNGNITQWLEPGIEPIESEDVPYLSVR